MDQNQQAERNAATEAFMESLDQLSQSLQSKPETVPSDRVGAQNPSKLQNSRSTKIDFKALEEAVADIEQFIQSNSPVQGG
ncbi:MAG: hypothetical protein HC769_25425 [Cyanobacteria bacterium CRU_2_1]|nr:hypothetical protein [Cyanobacteria bacterium RU_5_0]NJR61876.1 hypothetical protein [Cyanobacteria bacterium CRU_2_1]